MATLLEQLLAAGDDDLGEKMQAVIPVVALGIYDDPTPPANQTERLAWAKDALLKPKAWAETMISVVIAANKDATYANIIGASDAAIEQNVMDAVDLFAAGMT